MNLSVPNYITTKEDSEGVVHFDVDMVRYSLAVEGMINTMNQELVMARQKIEELEKRLEEIGASE